MVLVFDAVAAAAAAVGKTVNAVEKEAGLAKGTIGKWRTSEPRLGNLLAVCRVVNKDINEIVEMAQKMAQERAQDDENKR